MNRPKENPAHTRRPDENTQYIAGSPSPDANQTVTIDVDATTRRLLRLGAGISSHKAIRVALSIAPQASSSLTDLLAYLDAYPVPEEHLLLPSSSSLTPTNDTPRSTRSQRASSANVVRVSPSPFALVSALFSLLLHMPHNPALCMLGLSHILHPSRLQDYQPGLFHEEYLKLYQPLCPPASKEFESLQAYTRAVMARAHTLFLNLPLHQRTHSISALPSARGAPPSPFFIPISPPSSGKNSSGIGNTSGFGNSENSGIPNFGFHGSPSRPIMASLPVFSLSHLILTHLLHFRHIYTSLTHPNTTIAQHNNPKNRPLATTTTPTSTTATTTSASPSPVSALRSAMSSTDNNTVNLRGNLTHSKNNDSNSKTGGISSQALPLVPEGMLPPLPISSPLASATSSTSLRPPSGRARTQHTQSRGNLTQPHVNPDMNNNSSSFTTGPACSSASIATSASTPVLIDAIMADIQKTWPGPSLDHFTTHNPPLVYAIVKDREKSRNGNIADSEPSDQVRYTTSSRVNLQHTVANIPFMSSYPNNQQQISYISASEHVYSPLPRAPSPEKTEISLMKQNSRYSGKSLPSPNIYDFYRASKDNEEVKKSDDGVILTVVDDGNEIYIANTNANATVSPRRNINTNTKPPGTSMGKSNGPGKISGKGVSTSTSTYAVKDKVDKEEEDGDVWLYGCKTPWITHEDADEDQDAVYQTNKSVRRNARSKNKKDEVKNTISSSSSRKTASLMNLGKSASKGGANVDGNGSSKADDRDDNGNSDSDGVSEGSTDDIESFFSASDNVLSLLRTRRSHAHRQEGRRERGKSKKSHGLAASTGTSTDTGVDVSASGSDDHIRTGSRTGTGTGTSTGSRSGDRGTLLASPRMSASDVYTRSGGIGREGEDVRAGVKKDGKDGKDQRREEVYGEEGSHDGDHPDDYGRNGSDDDDDIADAEGATATGDENDDDRDGSGADMELIVVVDGQTSSASMQARDKTRDSSRKTEKESGKHTFPDNPFDQKANQTNTVYFSELDPEKDAKELVSLRNSRKIFQNVIEEAFRPNSALSLYDQSMPSEKKKKSGNFYFRNLSRDSHSIPPKLKEKSVRFQNPENDPTTVAISEIFSGIDAVEPSFRPPPLADTRTHARSGVVQYMKTLWENGKGKYKDSFSLLSFLCLVQIRCLPPSSSSSSSSSSLVSSPPPLSIPLSRPSSATTTTSTLPASSAAASSSSTSSHRPHARSQPQLHTAITSNKYTTIATHGPSETWPSLTNTLLKQVDTHTTHNHAPTHVAQTIGKREITHISSVTLTCIEMEVSPLSSTSFSAIASSANNSLSSANTVSSLTNAFSSPTISSSLTTSTNDNDDDFEEDEEEEEENSYVSGVKKNDVDKDDDVRRQKKWIRAHTYCSQDDTCTIWVSCDKFRNTYIPITLRKYNGLWRILGFESLFVRPDPLEVVLTHGATADNVIRNAAVNLTQRFQM